MTTFFQRLFRGGKPSAESAEPRLTLAVFGKHPGWDDYLGSGVDTGLGVDTETLAHVKRALHADGIRGQIDAGAWEKLEPAKRLEGFDHTFLWLRSGHVILGRLWSSTDGKRRRYPMVACIDGEGVAPGFVLAKARPELKRLRTACETATTAGQVTAEHRAAQQRLQSVLAESEEKGSEPFLPIQARRRFLAHPALGPDRLGLVRALHELASVPGVISDDGKLSLAASGNPRTSHLRLPLASDLRSEGLSLWAAFLRCAIPGTVPLLLISRSGVEWIDVIVGEPASDDFFWLQASLQASPLTTEIPFELSLELQPRLEKIEARFLGAEPPTAIKAAAPAARGPTPPSRPEVKAAVPDPAPIAPPAFAPGPRPIPPSPASVPEAPGPRPTPTVAPAPAPSPKLAAPAKVPVPKPTTGAHVPASKPIPPPPASSTVEKPATPARADSTAGQTAPQPAAKTSGAARLAGGGAAVLILAAVLLWLGRGWLSSPAHVTVTAESRTRSYGETNPPLSGSVNGLRKGDGISVAYRTTADARSPTGQYDIVPVLSDPKGKLAAYRVITNKGTLSVTPARLTVSATSQSRPYGARTPPPTVSIEGLRKGDEISAVPYTKADVASPVGKYDIVPVLKDPGDKLRNYLVTTNRGTLTISAAPLTVTARDQRRAYGSPNPSLTYEISGVVNGDSILVTNHTKAGVTSPVGSYEIVPELDGPPNKLGNYAVTTKKGTLTITPAAFTLTANNLSRAQGATNPVLTGWFTPNRDGITATYTTKADVNSPPGDYEILPALVDPSGKKENYLVTSNKGKLTVNAAAATPDVAPASAAVAAPGAAPASPAIAGETHTNKAGMEFVWIAEVPGGGAFVGKCEVTQEQFRRVMGQVPEGQLAVGGDRPVVNMGCSGATDFCARVGKLDGKRYSLPTEAEWLAAAKVPPGDKERAWSILRDKGMLEKEVTSLKGAVTEPARVGSRGAQLNGLCDMFGNVREWVIGSEKGQVVREEAAGFAYYSGVGLTTTLILFPAEPQEMGFRCLLRP
jgi:hypothetical protein